MPSVIYGMRSSRLLSILLKTSPPLPVASWIVGPSPPNFFLIVLDISNTQRAARQSLLVQKDQKGPPVARASRSQRQGSLILSQAELQAVRLLPLDWCLASTNPHPALGRPTGFPQRGMVVCTTPPIAESSLQLMNTINTNKTLGGDHLDTLNQIFEFRHRRNLMTDQVQIRGC